MNMVEKASGVYPDLIQHTEALANTLREPLLIIGED